ncbi:MAG TPA: 5-oxoprolinase subunit PxpB [Xanthomonadaceae bacterium]|nr:5-oxoprolinase subunit PxpB [Xanthomonadaceae bacterium]
MRVVEPLGEEALLLRVGDEADAQTNARVHALAAALEAKRPEWVRDIVPAYATLAVFVDVLAMEDVAEPLAMAEAWIESTLSFPRRRESSEVPPGDMDSRLRGNDGRVVEIPVRFGGDDGPDLAAVAAAGGLSEPDTVARFCAPTYQVAMLGFAPGFPYLLGLDPALAMPRLDAPRTRVPAGSVAIGGAQAGIYPREGPGGWRLLGRTPLGLFDPTRDPPALLAPGHRVRFVPAP